MFVVVELQDAIRTRRPVRTDDPARPVPEEALQHSTPASTRVPAPGRRRDIPAAPGGHDPVGAIAIGYDAEQETPDPRAQRRPAESTVHNGAWGN